VNWTGRLQMRPKNLVIPPQPVRDNLEQFDHDVANLFLLPALLGGNMLALGGDVSWSWGTLCAFLVYFVSDSLWIALHPRSVPQSRAVIAHHLLAVALVLRFLWGEVKQLPLQDARRDAVHCLLAAEVSTWFLIARRNVPYCRTLVSMLFHASWFYFRIYLYFSQWSKVFVQFVNHWFVLLDTDSSGWLTEEEFTQPARWMRSLLTFESEDLAYITIALVLAVLWTYDLIFAKVREECSCPTRA
jgi:hypothetical protein